MDLLSLIAGGIIGFLASIAKDWLIDNKKQKLKKQEFQKEKLEEIYLLFDKWQTNFTSIYLHYLRCYLNKLNYIDVLELTRESNLILPGEAQKLQMLINIHFPKLVNDYIPVNAARSNVINFFVNPKENKRSTSDFIKVQKEFEVVSKEFKSKIIAQVQEINI